MEKYDDLLSELSNLYGEDGRETEFVRNTRVSQSLMTIATTVTDDMASFMAGFQIAATLVRLHPEWISAWSQVKPSSLIPNEDLSHIDEQYEDYANAIVESTPIQRMSLEEIQAQIQVLVARLTDREG